jgi:mono/diheme cytochrome c family protein
MKTLCAWCSAIVVTLAMPLIFGPTLVRGQNEGQPSKPAEASAANAENGKRLYTKYGCYECHGREGQGGVQTGPRLGPDPIPFKGFASYIRKPTREMPPYTAKVMSDQELADIYAFLQSRTQPPVVKPSPF